MSSRLCALVFSSLSLALACSNGSFENTDSNPTPTASAGMATAGSSSSPHNPSSGVPSNPIGAATFSSPANDTGGNQTASSAQGGVGGQRAAAGGSAAATGAAASHSNGGSESGGHSAQGNGGFESGGHPGAGNNGGSYDTGRGGQPPGAGGGPSASGGGSSGDLGEEAHQACVDHINRYRAQLQLPPYVRWNSNELCTDTQAEADAKANRAHSAFGKCDETAQNECVTSSGTPLSVIPGCFQKMFDEGPPGTGAPGAEHGHYVAMTSTAYHKVSCGFYVAPGGGIRATQDFQ